MTLPNAVEIRRAGPTDAEALTHLHLDCWDEAYAALMPAEILAARRTTVPQRIDFWRSALVQGEVLWLADLTGEAIGFSGAGPGRDTDIDLATELRVLYLRKHWWGTGVGHDLLVAALGDDAAYLWVLEGNDRAIRFYERHGFQYDGRTEQETEGLHLRMVRRGHLR